MGEMLQTLIFYGTNMKRVGEGGGGDGPVFLTLFPTLQALLNFYILY